MVLCRGSFRAHNEGSFEAASKIALFVGPAVAAFVALVPTPEGLAPQGQRGLAILALCVIWWLLTPVALPVTSLLGMALLPLLGVLAPNESICLFWESGGLLCSGCVLVAAAMLRSGLSARLALWAMRFLARSENALCAAVLGLSALMCLVVVSHAVAALMLPIVLGLVRALDLRPRSATARRLILSLAWGSIIGSNLTLFASARASLALQVYGTQGENSSLHAAPIGVLQFTAATAGIVLLLLVMTYGLLRWLYPPEGIDMEPAVARLDEKVGELGGFSSKEWKTLLVIAAMVPSLVLLAPSMAWGPLRSHSLQLFLALGCWSGRVQSATSIGGSCCCMEARLRLVRAWLRAVRWSGWAATSCLLKEARRFCVDPDHGNGSLVYGLCGQCGCDRSDASGGVDRLSGSWIERSGCHSDYGGVHRALFCPPCLDSGHGFGLWHRLRPHPSGRGLWKSFWAFWPSRLLCS